MAPHLSYVSTLPDITQKLKRDIDKLNTDTLAVFLRASSTNPLPGGKHGGMLRASSTNPLTGGKHGGMHV